MGTFFKPNLTTRAEVEGAFGEIKQGESFVFAPIPDPWGSIQAGKPCKVRSVNSSEVTFGRFLRRYIVSWDRLGVEFERGLARYPQKNKPKDNVPK